MEQVISNEFKKEVLELHEQGWPPISIANMLYEKYNNKINYGDEFNRFRGRILYIGKIDKFCKK